MTQNEQIAKHLLDGYSLTHLECERLFDCSRLASRMTDLQGMGFLIKREFIKTPTEKHVKKYWFDNSDYAHNFKIFMTVFAPKPKPVTSLSGQIEWILQR